MNFIIKMIMKYIGNTVFPINLYFNVVFDMNCRMLNS